MILDLKARSVGVVAGVLADRVVGEPPPDWHPVAAFGAAMERVERRLWSDRRLPGVVYAAAGAAVGFGAGVVTEGVARLLLGPWLGTATATALATWSSSAGRMLREAAGAVGAALEAGDLSEARSRIPALVGRDPERLDPAGIVRAAVESVAENTVDAVVAPVLYAAAAGAPGALAYRAVNTLDSMVGYRNDRYARFGTASARLDDAANYLPARATAGLVALVRPAAAAEVRRAVRDDAPAHPSPNAGVAEAAFAAALGLSLGGRTDYGDRIEDRPVLGRGRLPVPADIDAACRLSRDVETALVVLVALLGR